MAIPNRQIGGSTTTNLLWQISKQLEHLICVRAGGCGITTNYNVAGCERMEYHVISYTGTNILPEGTIVNNATPECWYIIDQTTDPADVGTVTYVWPTLGECQPCIDSHTTTTTTTTLDPLVNSISTFVDCPTPCGEVACGEPFNYYNVWILQSCAESWPSIGCEVWLDETKTQPFTDGIYNNGNGGCITITDGIVTAIP